MIADAGAFFSAWRDDFGALTQQRVDGINALLAEMDGWSDPRWWAYGLATAYHETGGMMWPIKETVLASHKDRNPSDATVIARLEKAWKAGQLSWVKTPYWRDGWFGRGDVQITHEDNYAKLGKAVGVDLVANRDRALEPAVAAAILCVGMERGLFTGKSLPDYFDADTDDPLNARRIVNGTDRAELIAGYHAKALAAVKAGWGEPVPVPEVDDVAALRAEVTELIGQNAEMAARLAALERWASEFSEAMAARVA